MQWLILSKAEIPEFLYETVEAKGLKGSEKWAQWNGYVM